LRSELQINLGLRYYQHQPSQWVEELSYLRKDRSLNQETQFVQLINESKAIDIRILVREMSDLNVVVIRNRDYLVEQGRQKY